LELFPSTPPPPLPATHREKGNSGRGVAIYRYVRWLGVPPTAKNVVFLTFVPWYTDTKEKKIFLIYKEIQNGAVAKSYMTNGLLIYA
jgi:hypothetical protein